MKKFTFFVVVLSLGLFLSACEPITGRKESITVTFETHQDIYLHPLSFSRGQSLDLPMLQSVGGAMFVGWFFDEELTEPALDFSSKTTDFTLYAKWQFETYDVVIDVYNEIDVLHMATNNLAWFFVDKEGNLTIQNKTHNPLFNEPVRGDSVLYEKAFDFDSDGDIVVDAYESNAFIITSNGSLYAWGDNTYGQLGTNNKTHSAQFIDITSHFSLASDEKVIKITGNKTTTFALTNTGEVYAWGHNTANLLGDVTIEEALLPKRITDYICGQTDHFLVDIVVTDFHAIALSSENQLLLWGRNSTGWFGDVSFNTFDHPENITDLVSYYARGEVVKMRGAKDTFAILTTLDEVLLFGDLPLATPEACSSCSPVKFTREHIRNSDIDEVTIQDIYIVGDTLLVATHQGSLWGMGDNSTHLISGKKGYDYYKSLSDMRVAFMPNHLAMTEKEACALDSGELWCWGTNSNKSLHHTNAFILNTRYVAIEYEGNLTNYEGQQEDPNALHSPIGPMKWMAPEPISAVESVRPFTIYAVTRSHVRGIPVNHADVDTLPLIVRGVCHVFSGDCDDTDASVHPDAYLNYINSNRVIRWTLEVRVNRVEMA